jgi:hypothetical protein
VAIAPDQAASLLNAAFSARGPDEPIVTFEATGGTVVATARYRNGEMLQERMTALAPVDVTPGRYRAFAEGAASAARQVAAAAEDASELWFDAFLSPELLAVPELLTADGFRRATMNESGVRTKVRAQQYAAEIGKRAGVAAPSDEDGLTLLYVVGDPHTEGDLVAQSAQLRRLIEERSDLLPHLAAIVDGWADDPDGWWHGDAEDWSGPRLLAGLVRSLLARAPADRRAKVEAAVRRFDRLPADDVLRGAELL